jgi:hypothetical protein
MASGTNITLLLLAAAYTTIQTATCFTFNAPLPIYTSLYSTAYGYEAPINIEEDAPRDIASFEEWAYNYGIQRCEGHTLTSSQEEYGQPDIYAATDVEIPEGSCVLYVPEELILTSTKAMEELRGPEMQAAEKVLRSINAEDELRQYYLMIKVSCLVKKLL